MRSRHSRLPRRRGAARRPRLRGCCPCGRRAGPAGVPERTPGTGTRGPSQAAHQSRTLRSKSSPGVADRVLGTHGSLHRAVGLRSLRLGAFAAATSSESPDRARRNPGEPRCRTPRGRFPRRGALSVSIGDPIRPSAPAGPPRWGCATGPGPPSCRSRENRSWSSGSGPTAGRYS